MIRKVSESFSNLGLPRSKSLNDAFSIASSSFKPISSLSLSPKLSPKNNSSKKPSIAQSYGAPVVLDRYLTNEGHRLVVSYIHLTEVQKNIQQGYLHKVTEKDLDDLLRSYNGVSTNVYGTLNYQELSLTASECKLLAKLLKHDDLLNIKHLKLSKNGLRGSSLKSILESLHKNSTVITLDLSYNGLTDSDAKNIAKLIKKNNKIKEFYINHNDIKGKGAQYIAEALKVNKSIEKFSIEANHLGVTGGKHIADMLKVNDTLKYLHLGKNDLQLIGINHISESLKINKSIVSLSLDTNNIQSTGVNKLAEVLKTNKNLTHLYIPGNGIGDEGLKFICKALLQNTTLTYLDLEFNNIGAGSSNANVTNNNHNNNNTRNEDDENDDENVRIGMKSLGKLLEHHVVPRAINLTSNPIGNEGCEFIFSGFHKNKTLESLLLSNCRIGSEGARFINESLKHNSGLQNLSLYKNSQLGADGHLLIADALDKNTSLKGLQLDYNFDEWESVGNMIERCLTRNYFLQQEKYDTVCRILKASRIIMNTKQDYQPSSTSLTGKEKKIKLDQLPFEIKEQILAFLDSKDVLTKLQIISIVKWSMRRDTLGSTMKDFLIKILGAYYPLTSDVKLWPTEVVDGNALTNRFFN